MIAATATPMVHAGRVTVACWEAGQVSPHHHHPTCVEIHVCFEGGGIVRSPDRTVAVRPGTFVVHSRGELHEYENGPRRSLLFRVRYGDDGSVRIKEWRGNPAWAPRPEDVVEFGLAPA